MRSSIYGVFRFDPQTVGVLSVLPLLACCSGGCTILGTAIGESVDEVNWQRRTEPPDSLVGLQVRVAQAGSRPLVRRLVRVEVGEGGKQRLLLEPTGSESDVFERAPAGWDTVLVEEGTDVVRAAPPGHWRVVWGTVGAAVDLWIVSSLFRAPWGPSE